MCVCWCSPDGVDRSICLFVLNKFVRRVQNNQYTFTRPTSTETERPFGCDTAFDVSINFICKQLARNNAFGMIDDKPKR